ncbi:MmgE/PrpD family protein [Sinomonas atrocyanea]|uniref:MmgE/PrpD family protein n=1 Tax=Sinomonas atrocyanea TaxID=37927 RepID=UPI003D964FCF
MTDETRLTRDVAEWVAVQRDRALPPEVEHHVRRLILDHLAGVVASAVGPVSAAVGKHVGRTYPGGSATALGFGRSSVLGAAVVNGTNGHGIESDEGYTPGSMHPTSAVLPAVFAVAQEAGSSAEAILRASAIGMELACRIADAGHPATRNNHFHNTAIAGVLGAAAAVSALRGFDAELVANALGIAGSHAGGLFEFLGQSAEVKRLHPGKAARDGIVSADLAEAGLTGPTTVLEGTDGYFAAFAGSPGTDWNPGTVREGLGVNWVIRRTYVKPYPCCRHLHGAIDAVVALSQEHTLDIAEIESIEVGTFGIATRHAHTETGTVLDAQLSLPYTVALALVRGGVTLTDFDESSRSDPGVRKMMEKVRVYLDEAADAAYPKSGRPAEVTIRFADGSRVSHRVEQPYGEPDNPMSDQDLERKARGLAEPVIGEDGARGLIDGAWNFAGLAFLDDIDRAIALTRSPAAV